MLVLAAIVVGAVRLVEVVGLAAEGRGDRLVVALAATGLTCLVAAGTTHVVWLAAGMFFCVAIEGFGRPGMLVELPTEAKPELQRAA